LLRFNIVYKVRIFLINTTQMSDNDIVAIIEELRQLRIRELQVLSNLEATIANNRQQQDQEPPAPANRGVFFGNPYRVGDRVYITNRLTRKPRHRVTNEGDRISTVTKVFATRVEITTVNGQKTWRIPSNLRFARHDE
jgi:hypothetical protein